MTHTRVFKNLRFNDMRCRIIDDFKWINWRHHGIGCLQGYLKEGGPAEVRVHIWSPRLLKPGIDVSGDIHDHRFDMTSYVMLGRVRHEEIYVQPHAMGAHAISVLETHARASSKGGSLVEAREEPESYTIVKRDYFYINAGSAYTFPRRVFHRSPVGECYPEEIAITLIEKSSQTEEPARLLHRKSEKPVDAFGHEVHHSLIFEIQCEAFRRLKNAI